MRRLGVLLAISASLVVLVSVALAASSLSIGVPTSNVDEGSIFDVQVSGSTDEAGSRWEAFVQKANCPPTVAGAEAQPGAVIQDDTAVLGGGQTGSFAFTKGLTTKPSGVSLTGGAFVCSYLYTFSGITKNTKATAFDTIIIRPPVKPPPKLEIRIPARTRMTPAGKIVIAVVCPKGCNVTVRYRGVKPKLQNVARHVSPSPNTIGILLPLDATTKAFVKKARRQRKPGIPVHVKAVADPPTGASKRAQRTVIVG